MSISLRGKLRLKAIILVKLFLCAGMLQAQSEKMVTIVSARGGAFVLVRDNGIRQSFNPLDITTGSGITLKKSDMIQTTSSVFVELRVSPGTVSIYVAENSSLVFEDIGGASSTQVINLVYGRIRIDQQNDAETVIVKAGTSITETQKGSVNIDYIVNSSEAGYRSQPLLYVSTISGSAVLVPSTLSPAHGRVRINPNETLTFDALENKLEKTSINKEIVRYWSDKIGENKIGIVESDGSSLPPENVFNSSNVLTLASPESSNAERVARLKTGGIITGLILTLVGVTVQNVIHYTYDNIEKETADLAYYSGFLPIGMGAFILLASFLYPSY
jgi:3D (Asp-Asp-Asp) domain-containing protein